METLIVQPENKEQLKALKAFMKAMKIRFQKEEKSYSQEFITKMAQAEEDVQAGRTTKIEPADICDEESVVCR
ncbi:MAG: hypothetical protein EOP45_15145 [Sphingobacteriaceae bacterium]|nr:MAG: hypothetical protein EOP45_15145 [Sphingobacteriaceae bacterium]